MIYAFFLDKVATLVLLTLQFVPRKIEELHAEAQWHCASACSSSIFLGTFLALDQHS